MNDYLEKRKTHAFDLLEQAESFTTRGQYDRGLEYYHSAELILGEINFPTAAIKETIVKVEEKKREQDIQKQK